MQYNSCGFIHMQCNTVASSHYDGKITGHRLEPLPIMITVVEGKKKGPGAMQDGAILNKIKNIEKPNINDLDPNQSFQVSVTKMASIQVTAKRDWFSQQKRKGISDGSLRSDQLCTLVFAGYIVAEVPENSKNLMFYK